MNLDVALNIKLERSENIFPNCVQSYLVLTCGNRKLHKSVRQSAIWSSIVCSSDMIFMFSSLKSDDIDLTLPLLKSILLVDKIKHRLHVAKKVITFCHLKTDFQKFSIPQLKKSNWILI